MVLPLPQLDQRTWADLVAEGLARAPRYGPSWTDQNVSDPGVTLMELLAYKIEQSIYQANRVTSDLLWQFLALAGESALPMGLRAGRADLTFRLTKNAPAVRLPAGLLFLPRGVATEGPLLLVASDQPAPAPLRLRHELLVHPVSIQAVQTSDGRGNLMDVTKPWHNNEPFPAWGDNPIDPAAESATTYPPALFLALNQLPEAGEWLCVRVALDQVGSPGDERARLAATLAARARTRERTARPIIDPSTTPPVDSECWNGLPSPKPEERLEGDDPPTTVAWEFWNGSIWSPLMADDPTRGLTLDGNVRLQVPKLIGASLGSSVLRKLGVVPFAYAYIRCRLVSGLPDVSPPIARIDVNTVELEQAEPVTTTQPMRLIGPCLQNQGGPAQTFEDVKLDEFAWRYLSALDGRRNFGLSVCQDDRSRSDIIVRVGTRPSDAILNAATVRVWTRDGATGLCAACVLSVGDAADDGSTTLTLTADASTSVIAESVRLVSIEPTGATWTLHAWSPALQNDFVGASPTEAVYTLDPGSGAVTFGNGIRGRSVPAGTQFLAKFDYTSAGSGNPSPRTLWDVVGAVAMSPPTTTTALAPDQPTSIGFDPAPLSDAATPLADWNAALWLSSRHAKLPAQVNFEGLSPAAIASDPARAGVDAEQLDHALARLARFTQVHANLATNATLHGGTLDGQGLDTLLKLPAPRQAVTPADLERLALGTPGTSVQRVRAFSQIDPDLPGLTAPGTVTLAIVPGLPRDRPSPSPNLIRRVFSYLQPIRGLGTRLRLVGPVYSPWDVTATLRVGFGNDPATVAANAKKALQDWLDPLGDGVPKGTGPRAFGRDILRTEVLTQLAAVDGVTEVDGLTLTASLGAPTEFPPWLLPAWGTITLKTGAAT